jgi:hypothetical protein
MEKNDEGLKSASRASSTGKVRSSDAVHTPGSWTFEQTSLSICRLLISTEDVDCLQISPVTEPDYAIAYVPNDYECDRQTANARLIAAAPELLKTLKEISAWFDEWKDVEILDRVNIAIAKAEGTAGTRTSPPNFADSPKSNTKDS